MAVELTVHGLLRGVSHSRAGRLFHFWAAKRRSRPGARFLAMSAASMGMVPLPQKGSQKGSFPR